MSKSSKGIKIEKILEQFDKADVDDQIKAYYKIKSHLNNKILSRSKELEEKNNEYQTVLEEINGKEK